jgi:hypothetical protein
MNYQHVCSGRRRALNRFKTSVYGKSDTGYPGTVVFNLKSIFRRIPRLKTVALKQMIKPSPQFFRGHG